MHQHCKTLMTAIPERSSLLNLRTARRKAMPVSYKAEYPWGSHNINDCHWDRVPWPHSLLYHLNDRWQAKSLRRWRCSLELINYCCSSWWSHCWQPLEVQSKPELSPRYLKKWLLIIWTAMIQPAGGRRAPDQRQWLISCIFKPFRMPFKK